MSVLQAAITSLSFFAWKIRETAPRLPFSATSSWISSMVLIFKAW